MSERKKILFEFRKDLAERVEEVKIDEKKLSVTQVKNGLTIPLDNLRVNKDRIFIRFKDGSFLDTPLKGGDWKKVIVVDNLDFISSRNLIFGGFISLLILIVGYISFPVIKDYIFLLTTPALLAVLYGFYVKNKGRYGVIFRP